MHDPVAPHATPAVLPRLRPAGWRRGALLLLGVALFHHHTLKVAVTGAVVITLYKLLIAGFKEGAGLSGLSGHIAHCQHHAL